jgi:predicted  nucleic acid-binding Zn-ribbon protein
MISMGSKEILDGCSSCSGRFFFYIKEGLDKQETQSISLDSEKIVQASKKEKEKI